MDYLIVWTIDSPVMEKKFRRIVSSTIRVIQYTTEYL